jgi:hypothetical protein
VREPIGLAHCEGENGVAVRLLSPRVQEVYLGLKASEAI